MKTVMTLFALLILGAGANQTSAEVLVSNVQAPVGSAFQNR